MRTRSASKKWTLHGNDSATLLSQCQGPEPDDMFMNSYVPSEDKPPGETQSLLTSPLPLHTHLAFVPSLHSMSCQDPKNLKKVAADGFLGTESMEAIRCAPVSIREQIGEHYQLVATPANSMPEMVNLPSMKEKSTSKKTSGIKPTRLPNTIIESPRAKVIIPSNRKPVYKPAVVTVPLMGEMGTTLSSEPDVLNSLDKGNMDGQMIDLTMSVAKGSTGEICSSINPPTLTSTGAFNTGKTKKKPKMLLPMPPPFHSGISNNKNVDITNGNETVAKPNRIRKNPQIKVAMPPPYIPDIQTGSTITDRPEAQDISEPQGKCQESESANGFEAGVPSLGIPSSAQHSPTQSDRYNNSFPQMIALPSTPYSHLFQNITTRSDCQSNIKIRRYKVLSIQDCLDAVGRLHDLETPDGANGHNVGEFGNVVARDSFHRGVFPPTSFEAPSSQFDDIGDLEQFIDYDGGSAV